MADQIIEELWRIKDGIAHEYGYNVDMLVAHLEAQGISTGQKVVDLRAKDTVEQNSLVGGVKERNPTFSVVE